MPSKQNVAGSSPAGVASKIMVLRQTSPPKNPLLGSTGNASGNNHEE